MFITFEGLDFSGKTTQARRLVDHLLRTGGPVQFLREPGGTAISERVRAILLDRKNFEMAPLAELFLFSASRAQLVAEVIRPALSRGEIVICDRFDDSTTVYQGYGRGLDLGAILTINTTATGNLSPDLTIIVDITLEEMERRRRATGAAFDRMESSGRAFYERVRAGYLDLSHQDPERCVLVDGMRPEKIIQEEVVSIVQRRLEGKKK